MKFIWLFCILSIFSVSSSAQELDTPGQAAYATLKTVPYFATGGVSYAGSLSKGEEALRVLLKQKQAENALEALLKEAKPAGQMYALLGLKQSNPAIFAKLVPRYLAVQTMLQTMNGCIVEHKTVADVAAEIKAGKHSLAIKQQEDGIRIIR